MFPKSLWTDDTSIDERAPNIEDGRPKDFTGLIARLEVAKCCHEVFKINDQANGCSMDVSPGQPEEHEPKRARLESVPAPPQENRT